MRLRAQARDQRAGSYIVCRVDTEGMPARWAATEPSPSANSSWVWTTSTPRSRR